MELTFRAWPEGRQYVSVNDEFGSASCGDTAGEAIDNVVEATLLYLNTLEDIQDRERVFQERNIQVLQGPPVGRRVAAAHENEMVSTLVVGSGLRPALA